MSKKRGRETRVKCGLCGRLVPRSKCKIVYRRKRKEYICPKCARFLSLRVRRRRVFRPSIRPP